MKRQGKLIFLCGKMASGKSTLAKELAAREDAVLLVLDDFLERLFPGQVVDVASFVTYSSRIRDALAPHICSLLSMGISVVLDFPGNTRKQRSWFRQLYRQSGAEHELHFIEASDDVCKRQLRERSSDLPPGEKWTTDAEFDAITAYFEPPSADENFNVVHHERAAARSQSMTEHPIQTWHRLVREHQPAGLDQLLAEDAVFLSPVVHTPQRGRHLTKWYLSAAFQVFFNDTFKYVREIVGAKDAMLEFETTIDGILVNGVDLIKWNEAGQIIEFKVMLRPLKAINLVHERMAAMLKSLQGQPPQ